MYKEFAIDPKCMGSFEYYALLKSGFGFDLGRYASADVKAWAREAYQVTKLSDMGPVKRKSIVNFLNTAQKNKKDSIFLDIRDSKNCDQWRDWYRLESKRRPFAGTISEDEDVDDRLSSVDITNNDARWKVSSASSCKKSGVAIVEELVPLVELSRRILLVDSYLVFTRNDVLRCLIESVQQHKLLGEIEVVTSMKTKNPERIYEQEYKGANRRGVNLILTQVVEQYFHDRYFITDRGAIKPGQGFSSGPEKGAFSDRLRLNRTTKDEADDVKDSLKFAKDKGIAAELFVSRCAAM